MGQSTPIKIVGRLFDTETIALLQSVLDEIWAELTDAQRDQLPRSLITGRLLRAAAEGERDREALRLEGLGGAAAGISIGQQPAKLDPQAKTSPRSECRRPS